jgi:DNA-binding beta-propeller fold protein YncE
LSGFDGSVAIIDLATNKVTKTLTGIGAGCERMAFVSDQLLVLNKGGYGVDSTITAIDYKADTIIKRIKTGDNPSSLASSTDGNLWILSSGAYDFVSMTTTPAKLGKLFSDGTITYPNGSFKNISQGADDLVVNIDGDLFFNNPGEMQISVVRRNSNTITKFADGFFYGLAAKEDEIWATDAKDYSSAGQVIIFKNDGTRRDSFVTGVTPGEIYFKY